MREVDPAAQPAPTDESEALLFTAGVLDNSASDIAGATSPAPCTGEDELPAIVAHPAASAPADAIPAVQTAAELEALVLRAERQAAINALAVDRQAVAWLNAQVNAASELADRVATIRTALESERDQCKVARSMATPVMDEFSASAAEREREAAAAAARAAQLRPIEEARAVAAMLDSISNSSASRSITASPHHDARHPLVAALATLDGSIAHVQANPNLESASTHLSELCTLRCRALRVVATQHVSRPLDLAVEAMARPTVLRKGASGRMVGPTDTCVGALSGNVSPADSVSGRAPSTSNGTMDTLSTASVEGEATSHAKAAGATATPTAATTSFAASSSAADEVRFLSLAARLRPWIRELEVRAAEDAECAVVLSEASRSYWRARRALLGGQLTTRLRAVISEDFVSSGRVRSVDGGLQSKGQGVAEAVGQCCAEAMFLCRSESQLHAAFFNSAPMATDEIGSASPSVASELEALALPLIDVVRPLLLRMKSIGSLSGVIMVLDTEAYEARRLRTAAASRDVVINGPRGADATSNAAGTAVESLLLRLLGDARERLTFRIQTTIRDEIRSFDHNSTVAIGSIALISGEKSSTNDTSEGATSPSDRWYPTLRVALELLSQAYACLPRAVFEGISQEVLEACTSSLLSAASRHTVRLGSPRESRLLLVSQLLILREQIAPFDSTFVVTTKALDFSATRALIRDLTGRGVSSKAGSIAGRSGASTTSTQAVSTVASTRGILSRVVELLQRSAPSVVCTQSDAKGALEAELRKACEAFINETTTPATKPVLDVLPIVDGTEKRAAASAPSASVPAATPSATELDTCFAAAETALDEIVACAYARMGVYLPQPATQAILFTPIKSSILDAYGRLATFLNATGRAGGYEQRLRKLATKLEEITTPSRSTPM